MSIINQGLNIVQNLSPQEKFEFGTSAWEKRRLVIFTALLICAFIIVIISVSSVGLFVYSALATNKLEFDQNLISLISNLAWAIISLAASIIASYVFGANMDTNSYRQAVKEVSVTALQTNNTLPQYNRPPSYGLNEEYIEGEGPRG